MVITTAQALRQAHGAKAEQKLVDAIVQAVRSDDEVRLAELSDVKRALDQASYCNISRTNS